MEKRRKILYFMPDNPMKGKAGNLMRCNQLLSYFNQHAELLDVHFVAEHSWKSWNEVEKANFHALYPHIKLTILNRKVDKRNLLSYIFLHKLPNYIYGLFFQDPLNLTTIRQRKAFQKLCATEDFDSIIISYVQWAGLIKDLNANLILDTHDFITAQSRDKKNKIGKHFQAEMAILRGFDQVWTYSSEEQYLFEQFVDNEVVLMPVSFAINFHALNPLKKYPVIYVASDNPHNVRSAQWFVNEVAPLLGSIEIHFFGAICAQIGDHPSIIKHGIVEDLSVYYQQAKIAICPMLSGTGIKIKVVEALSYGLPVVTNRRGVDGLSSKHNNGCLIAKDAAEFAQHITELLTSEEKYQVTHTYAKDYFMSFHDPAIEMTLLNSIFVK